MFPVWAAEAEDRPCGRGFPQGQLSDPWVFPTFSTEKEKKDFIEHPRGRGGCSLA